MEKEFKEILSHFQRSKRKLWSQEAARWANIFLWRQETRDKRQDLDRVFLLFILVKLCLQSSRQFFFLLAPLFVLGSPSMGTNRYFLSLGVYKLTKAALFVWGAVKWRYYTVLPDIVIVISEQDNLRCTWLTELSKGNWSKPAQSRFI